MLDIALVQALIASVLALFPTIPSGVSDFVTTLTSQLPMLAAAGTDIRSFIETQMGLVQDMINERRDPTDDEWNSLNTTLTSELAKLNLGGINPVAPGQPATTTAPIMPGPGA